MNNLIGGLILGLVIAFFLTMTLLKTHQIGWDHRVYVKVHTAQGNTRMETTYTVTGEEIAAWAKARDAR